MNAYIDASVILREVLHQTPSLREWDDLIVGVTSRLARVECRRTVERLIVNRAISEANAIEVGKRLQLIFERLIELPLDNEVLGRAEEPLPTPLKTLDAIHLVTALFHREQQTPDEPSIYFATFDIALAQCARATGFRVLGA